MIFLLFYLIASLVMGVLQLFWMFVLVFAQFLYSLWVLVIDTVSEIYYKQKVKRNAR